MDHFHVWSQRGARLASVLTDQKLLAQDIVIYVRRPSSVSQARAGRRVRPGREVWASTWSTVLQNRRPGHFRVGRQAGGGQLTQQKGHRDKSRNYSFICVVLFYKRDKVESYIQV